MTATKARIVGVLALVLVLAGCGATAATSRATATPTASPTATATPTPTPPPPPATVYGTNGNTLYALDSTTGAKKWTYSAGQGGPELSQVTVAGDEVLFLSDNLYALSASDGSLRWKVSNSPSPVLGANLFVAGPVLLLSEISEASYPTTAFDLATGKVLWRESTPSIRYIMGGTLLYTLNPSYCPSQVGCPSPTADQQGFIAALDPVTGTDHWKVKATPFYTMALVGDTLYAAQSQSNVIIGYDAQTGAQVWSAAFGPATNAQGRKSSAWIADSFGNTVYVEADHLYAVDGVSHKVLWQVNVAGLLQNGDGVLVVDANSLGTFAYDPSTGQQLWHDRLMTMGGYQPIADGSVYVGELTSSLGQSGPTGITALDLHTGAVMWTVNGQNVLAAKSGTVYTETPQSGPTSHAIIRALGEARGTTLWTFDAGQGFATVALG